MSITEIAGYRVIRQLGCRPDSAPHHRCGGAIIDLLSVKGHTVSAIVEAVGISQPLASQHLRTLRTAGLVEVEHDGRTSVYRLADEHVAHIFLDALQHSRETPG